jgi:ElaB/YqjD/DUF883 family membrane-anchored ribosome-binding protein
MSTERAPSAGPGAPGVPAELPDDPDQLRHQIEETRAEVAKTVEALAAKADVKGQVKEKLGQVKEQATAKVSEFRDHAADVGPDQAREVLTTVERRAKERPLLPFVAGIVVGFMLGKVMG